MLVPIPAGSFFLEDEGRKASLSYQRDLFLYVDFINEDI